jgi:small-conductance mechanosensitive channel
MHGEYSKKIYNRANHLMIKEFFIEIIKIFHSNHPFLMLMSDIKLLLSAAWNYKIYVASDNQAILIGNILIALLLFVFGIKLAHRLSRHIKKKLPSSLDKSTASAFERISYYFFLIIVTVFVLDITHVPLTIFTVIGTTIALGIGLGSQNMANNFISGLIIIFERPIKLGDIIEIRNVIGKVTNIGARCVSITTPDNIIMLIPNSSILQDIVINWTLEDSILRHGLDFIVDNSSDIKIFDQVVLKAANEHKHILKSPAPETLLKGLCKDGFKIELKFWTDLSVSGHNKYVINELNRNLISLFKENNIKIIDEIEVEPIVLSTK